VAAQVLLNGGLFELNYEFSAVEELQGLSDNPSEHYYSFDVRHHTIDPHKAAFVGEIARARVGAANRFLAYGRMRPAPTVEAPPASLSYYTYNVPKDWAIYEDRGTMTVPSALASAWEHEGRRIWLVANLVPEAQEIRVDGKPLSLSPRQVRVVEL
jgi:hypothetical protein